MINPKFKVGDKVKIIANSNSHIYAINTVVTLGKYKGYYDWEGHIWVSDDYKGGPYNISEKDLEMVEMKVGVDCLF